MKLEFLYLEDSAKAVLKGKFIALNVNIREEGEKKSQYSKASTSNTQKNSKQAEEENKVGAGINKIETKPTEENQ